MSIITWNVRGLNSPERRLDLSNFLKTENPSIVGLLEHKLDNSTIMDY